jgi:2-desacetyl-2-hydroxyethyl bacteriochlorophyllide A dehydrogenase
VTEHLERVVRIVAPGRADLAATEPLAPGPGQVRLRTLYSGISAGTELTTYCGSNPYLHRRWEPGRRLFLEGAASVTYPVVGAGYEEVGEVVELGPAARGVVVGDVVWGIWGHRSDGVLPAAAAARQLLPAGTDPVVGVFARAGAVALNAVIEADLHVGETVAIFGQGVIGLLATRLATLNGARVVAVDLQPGRLRTSERFGAAYTVAAADRSAAEAVRALTSDRGADACIELSGTYPAVQEAIRTCCYGGRVVAAGFYQGEGGALRLGEEFHHNRVELVSSQISGPPARYSHRWTRERLHEGFMDLVIDGRVDPLPLISHIVPASKVAQAYATVAAGGDDLRQVVLDFRQENR